MFPVKYRTPKATAKTIKGEDQTLGLWDEEKPYKKFITYGAKKYAYYYDDDKLHITVSGLSKSAASEIGKIENFVPGLTVQNSGRTIAVYDDNIKKRIIKAKIFFLFLDLPQYMDLGESRVKKFLKSFVWI